MRYYRNFNAEDWRNDRLAKERLVALIIWVSYQSYARWQQFGTSGLNIDGITIWLMKGNPMVGTRPFPILELGLSDRCPKGYVP